MLSNAGGGQYLWVLAKEYSETECNTLVSPDYEEMGTNPKFSVFFYSFEEFSLSFLFLVYNKNKFFRARGNIERNIILLKLFFPPPNPPIGDLKRGGSGPIQYK